MDLMQGWRLSSDFIYFCLIFTTFLMLLCLPGSLWQKYLESLRIIIKHSKVKMKQNPGYSRVVAKFVYKSVHAVSINTVTADPLLAHTDFLQSTVPHFAPLSELSFLASSFLFNCFHHIIQLLSPLLYI